MFDKFCLSPVEHHLSNSCDYSASAKKNKTEMCRTCNGYSASVKKNKTECVEVAIIIRNERNISTLHIYNILHFTKAKC